MARPGVHSVDADRYTLFLLQFIPISGVISGFPPVNINNVRLFSGRMYCLRTSAMLPRWTVCFSSMPQWRYVSVWNRTLCGSRTFESMAKITRRTDAWKFIPTMAGQMDSIIHTEH